MSCVDWALSSISNYLTFVVLGAELTKLAMKNSNAANSSLLWDNITRYCTGYSKHIAYSVDTEYEGFQDTVTYFRISQNLTDVMILGFHIPSRIHAANITQNGSKYFLVAKDYIDNQTHEYELSRQTTADQPVYYVSTPDLEFLRRAQDDVYFRILVYNLQLKEKSVLILNQTNIVMVVSKSWSSCENLKCVKIYKEWNDLVAVTNITSDANFVHRYYKKCTSKFSFLL